VRRSSVELGPWRASLSSAPVGAPDRFRPAPLGARQRPALTRPAPLSRPSLPMGPRRVSRRWSWGPGGYLVVCIQPGVGSTGPLVARAPGVVVIRPTGSGLSGSPPCEIGSLG